MSIDKGFTTLGDVLLRRYTSEFIGKMQSDGPLSKLLKENRALDLETVIKEANEISFEALYGTTDESEK